MKIRNARLAFESIHEKSTTDLDKTPKYRATFIIPKDHPQYSDLMGEIKRVAKAKWPDGFLPESDKICVRDGSIKRKKDGSGYTQGFGPDMVFFNATSKDTKPRILDRDLTELTKEDGKPYNGCYVNVIVGFWAQDNKFGKRINAGLEGVQFFADGEAFGGGRVAAVSEFDNEVGMDDDLDDEEFSAPGRGRKPASPEAVDSFLG